MINMIRMFVRFSGIVNLRITVFGNENFESVVNVFKIPKYSFLNGKIFKIVNQSIVLTLQHVHLKG